MARPMRRQLLAMLAATVLMTAALGAWIAVGSMDEPDLGIFTPLAGRMVGLGDGSLWGADPTASDPTSTEVRVDLPGFDTTEAEPLGWSSDGTKLLFSRQDPADQSFPYEGNLYILNADGGETQVTAAPVTGGAISPDGTRVAFTSADTNELFVVDADGGRESRIAHEGASPTFSPDGTRIAYLLPTHCRHRDCQQAVRAHVWMVNADGSGAHEILDGEPTLAEGASSLTWSPAADRLMLVGFTTPGAIGMHSIYTFAPDGSELALAIRSADRPRWSPDGSQIYHRDFFSDGFAYLLANADGSNPRIFLYCCDGRRWGAWHPGALQGASRDAGL